MAHLILDLDGTLTDAEGIGMYRPHLQEFIDFAFERFESVNIWTAAGQRWFNKIYDDLLSPILKNREFGFVWFGIERCSIQLHGRGYLNYKDLEDVWDEHEHLTRENTIILDDFRHTVKNNPGNALYIPTFKNRISGPDTYLSTTMVTLDQILKKFETSRNIRSAVLKTGNGLDCPV